MQTKYRFPCLSARKKFEIRAFVYWGRSDAVELNGQLEGHLNDFEISSWSQS